MEVDKRAILQPILDGIEPGWELIKPLKEDPADLEHLSVFQNSDENKVMALRVFVWVILDHIRVLGAYK